MMNTLGSYRRGAYGPCRRACTIGWPARGRETPVAAEQPLRGFVILVVEDDVDTLDSITNLIGTALGCGVLRASTGIEALEIIDAGTRVDLVFSDIMMPTMDGLTLTDEVRKRLPTIPIVLATGLTTV